MAMKTPAVHIAVNNEAIAGDAADGLLVNLGTNNDVTVSGTVTVQDSSTLVDNAAFTDGTSSVIPAGYIFDDVLGNPLTENDVAAARINENRAQVNVIEDGATRARYATVTGSNALKVDGSAVTQPVEDSASLLDNAGFTDGSSRVIPAGFIYDEVAGGALTENDAAAARINVNRAQVGTIEDGTTRGRYATVTASNALKVDGSAVTQPISGTVTSNAVGDVAHDTVDSGNPVKMGAKAVNFAATPTAVAAADRSDLYSSRSGVLFVLGGHPNIVSAEYNTDAARTDDPVISVVSAGTRIVITQIMVISSAATTVSPQVRIGFGASAVPAEGASGADGVAKVVLSHPGISPGSGIIKGNGAGIVGIGGDGEDLFITCGAPTSGKLTVQVDYFTEAV